MNLESPQKKLFPFKREDWTERKKELKIARSQRQNKNLKAICAAELQSDNQFNYMAIEAPKSAYPPKKYCDITGYETKYKDKETGIYYHDKKVFNYLKNLPKPYIENYLAIRKVAINY